MQNKIESLPTNKTVYQIINESASRFKLVFYCVVQKKKKKQKILVYKK